MKKKLLIVGLATLSFSAGAFALTGVQKITAELRPDIKLVQDGRYEVLRDATGNILYPLSYNGSTYLPIRSVANLSNQEVNWNSSTNTITLTSANSQATLPIENQSNKVSTTDSYNSTLASLESKVNSITNEVTNWSPSANRTAEYNTLDSKIEAINYELSIFDDQLELDYNSSKLDATTYIALDKNLNILDKKLDTTENNLDTKYHNSNIPAPTPVAPTPNITTGTTKPTTTAPTTNASTNSNIKKFQSRATALINEVKALKPASSYQSRLNQYRSLDIKLETLERDMDYYEDSIERDYRAGKLSYNSFISLDRELERIENSIDHLSDTLEYKLGIDD